MNTRLSRVDRQRVSLALWMALGSILISVLLSGGFYLTVTAQQNRTEMLAIENHDVLCTFKNDLVQRVEGTRAFLETHPQGIGGISREDLERSAANQQATIDALSALKC